MREEYKVKWYEEIWWPIENWFSDARFNIRMAWQRVFRGFDDTYWWGHHSSHAEMTAQAMRILASHKHGCPGELWDDVKDGDPCHQWKAILIEIAEGFEAATAIDNLDYMGEFDSPREWKLKEHALKKKFNNAMVLYRKWYFNLWD